MAMCPPATWGSWKAMSSISLSVYQLVLPLDHLWVSDYFSYSHEQFNALNGQIREVLEGLSEIGLQTSSRQHQAMLIRDVVSNPYRQVAFCQKWRTATATALAQRMYESRDFGAMPILADALEESGCDSEEILGHCREPGPHVRGCWVVDAALGKK